MMKEFILSKSHVADLDAENMERASLIKRIPKDIKQFHAQEKSKCTSILAMK